MTSCGDGAGPGTNDDDKQLHLFRSFRKTERDLLQFSVLFCNLFMCFEERVKLQRKDTGLAKALISD